MRHFWTLLKMSLRSYYRNGQAIAFGLVFPMIIMIIFGVLNLGAAPKSDITVIDRAHNADSKRFTDALGQGDLGGSLKLHDDASQDAALAELNKGHRDLVVVVPEGWSASGQKPLQSFLNQARPTQSGAAQAIVSQVAGGTFAGGTGAAAGPPAYALIPQKIPGKNMTYTDFLVPGIIGMTVMQTGVFSIAFVVVRLKGSGVLRRLMATPMSKLEFLGAEVITRLIMGVIQICLLIGIATLLLGFHLGGSVPLMVLIASLASAVFISLGFVVSSLSKNEDSVPAIANILVLPMMFLIGVFFSTDSIPSWLRVVSDRLPLTYLNDALRGIAIEGKTVSDLGGDVLGLLVWLVILAFAATRLFRWEPA
jgi:ABC-2 type transport system permease protein